MMAINITNTSTQQDTMIAMICWSPNKNIVHAFITKMQNTSKYRSSLVPMPFQDKDRKVLVHTVCSFVHVGFCRKVDYKLNPLFGLYTEDVKWKGTFVCKLCLQ